MTFFHVVLVLAVVGLVAAVATGKVRGGLPAPTTSRPDLDLPSGALTPADIDTVRFSVGLRGYRMDEVDAVLDRLSEEVGAREREIAELRARSAPAAHDPATELPVAGNLAAEDPVADEAVADEAVADEAVADEPVADKPAAEHMVAADPPATVVPLEHLPERLARAEHRGSDPA